MQSSIKILQLSLMVLVLMLTNVSFTNAQDPSVNQSGAAELTWKNGDKVPGRIVTGDSKFLQWQADRLFRDPLRLDLKYLQQIDFKPSQPNFQTSTTYSVQTIDGVSLFGEIKSLDATILTIESARFGEIKVLRDRIATILNLKNSGNLINGDFDLKKWSASRGQKKYWTVNDQGELESLRPNTHLYLKTQIPTSAMIELELKWDQHLDFIFGFGVPRNIRKVDSIPRLESWEDSLVFNYHDDFEVVLDTIKRQEKKEKRLKLLMHWDQENHKVVIHDERGQPLAVADLGTSNAKFDSGIYIENKAGDLIISQLAVRHSSPGFNAMRPSIQRKDEPTINGELVTFDGENWLVKAAINDPSKELSSKELSSKELSSKEPDSVASDLLEHDATDAATNIQDTIKTTLIPAAEFCGAFLINDAIQRPSEQARLNFYDGMFVSGELISIEPSRLTFNTTFSSDPVTFQLGNTAKIRFDSPPPSTETATFTHQLFNAAGEIRGRLEPGNGSPDDVLRWRVAGAEKAVPFSAADARIVLQPKQPIVSVEEKWGDTLYLNNRDTIPCRVVRIDEQAVSIESFTEIQQIDPQLIKAIDFRNELVGTTIKAQDSDWYIPRNSKRKVTVAKNKDLFTLSKKGVLGHPWLLTTGGFEFDLNWQQGQYGVLQLQLFSGDPESNEGGKKLSIGIYGENIFVGETSDGIDQNKMLEVKNKTPRVAVKYDDGKLAVFVDGKKAYSQAVRSNEIKGRGVRFELFDMYQQQIKCELSKFEMIFPEVGSSTLIDPVRKELLLTIPRLKQNKIPGQIICAANADMLRGDLISLDQQFVSIRASNELQQFPREIVSSIVWLHAESLAASGAPSPELESEPAPLKNLETSLHQTVQILMQGNRRMTTTLKSWANQQLTGNSSVLGQCEIPFDQIYELRFGSFATAADDIPYADWIAKLAPAPKLETGADGQVGTARLFGSASPLIGTEPKSFALELLDGTKLKLDEQRGKIVVLDFWATWCGPCVQALPEMVGVIDNYTDDEVILFAVNQEESTETIQQFLDSRKLDFTVALDSGGIASQFGVESLPTTIVIDGDGRVAFVNVGHSNGLTEKLTAAIEQLLGAN